MRFTFTTIHSLFPHHSVFVGLKKLCIVKLSIDHQSAITFKAPIKTCFVCFLLSDEMFIKPLGQSVKTNIRSVFTLFASTLILINNVR